MNGWDGCCHRCRQPSISHIMSMFNTELLCADCKGKEERHPDYAHARDVERAHVEAGDYNFKGVGRPADL